MDEASKMFVIEAQGLISKAEKGLLALEKDPSSNDWIVRVFRALHNIKGSGGCFGFSKIEKISHAAESLLSDIKEGRQTLSPSMVSWLLGVLDTLQNGLNLIEKEGHDQSLDIQSMLEKNPLQPASNLIVDDPNRYATPASQHPAKQPAASEVERTVAPQESATQFLQMDVALADSLIRLTGELILVKNRLSDLSNQIQSQELADIVYRLSFKFAVKKG